MNKAYVTCVILIGWALAACASQPNSQWRSDHYNAQGEFYNAVNIEKAFSISRFMTISKRFLFEAHPDTEPFSLIPYQQLTVENLQTQTEDMVVRLGHSTILMKLSEQYVLTDPIFSERASPVQWAGPQRFHPVPIDVNTLPEIAAVVISHDHYDHLDEGTIKLLAKTTQNFVVPLGVAKHLIGWGVSPQRIHEMDWWQSVELNGMTFTSTPSQHFSGRGLFDRNASLWSSWVIDSTAKRIFFSGDSGYFDGFKTIGEKYGPFDLTILENGAYNPDWSQVHMFPAETVQANLDLKGKAMLPVHNGTFKLSFHPWSDPLEQVTQLAEQKNMLVQTPIMGQPVLLGAEQAFAKWWQGIENSDQLLADKDK